MISIMGKSAIQQAWQLAQQGYDASQYAYGRALEEGLAGMADKGLGKLIGAVHIDNALAQGRNQETLERMYQNFYRPAFMGRTSFSLQVHDR